MAAFRFPAGRQLPEDARRLAFVPPAQSKEPFRRDGCGAFRVAEAFLLGGSHLHDAGDCGPDPFKHGNRLWVDTTPQDTGPNTREQGRVGHGCLHDWLSFAGAKEYQELCKNMVAETELMRRRQAAQG